MHRVPSQKPNSGSPQQIWKPSVPPQQVASDPQQVSSQHLPTGGGQQLTPPQHRPPASQHALPQQLPEQQSPFEEQGPPTGCRVHSHNPVCSSQVRLLGQFPHVPPLPQPSAPHALPAQLGAQQSPNWVHWLAGASQQLSPQQPTALSGHVVLSQKRGGPAQTRTAKS